MTIFLQCGYLTERDYLTDSYRLHNSVNYNTVPLKPYYLPQKGYIISFSQEDLYYNEVNKGKKYRKI